MCFFHAVPCYCFELRLSQQGLHKLWQPEKWAIMAAPFSGGFYLFTFWSSKQTEPFNLSDNRCLTISLRVQRYDYFFI